MTVEETISVVPFRRAAIELYGIEGETGYARTICELIDHNAALNPDHVFCIQANRQAPPSTTSNLLVVTHQQLKIAVDRCARKLETQIIEAHQPQRNEDGSWTTSAPVALLAESDINLLIHEFALISLGIPVLLLSARLNPDAVRHLLSKTGAAALLVSRQLKHLAMDSNIIEDVTGKLVPAYPLQPLAPLLELLAEAKEDSKKPLGTPGYYRGYEDCNVIILHSSGTTGLPKPIYHSHAFLMSFANCHLLHDETEAQALNVSTLPLFHGFGLVAPGLSLGIGKTVCLPAPSVPATGTSILQLLRQVKAGSLMSVPSILEEISHILNEANNLEVLASLNFIAFGGGLLKSVVGDRLTQGKVKLLNHYGTTESGPLAPMFAPKIHDGYDWRFFRLREDIKLQVSEVSKATATDVAKFKLTTYPYGWGKPFEIQDQLITNPANSGRDFSAIGRKDAFIALATGEKVDPSMLEASLTDLEEVKATLAFGIGQFELGLLVQPTSKNIQCDQYDAFKLSIWPAIEKLNKKMDAHAKISSPAAILIVPSDEQLPRTDKGSIMRMQTYERYAKEIADIYADLDRKFLSEENACPLYLETLDNDVKNMIQTRLPHWRLAASDWSPTDDFFELGMDSLQVLHLQRILKASVKYYKGEGSLLAEKHITSALVYQNSSVAALTLVLRSSTPAIADATTRTQKINDIVFQFSHDSHHKGRTVLLTGGTGSLGVHVLSNLLANPEVEEVICLNRPGRHSSNSKDPMIRQREAAASRAVNITEAQWKKCEVIEATASNHLLGLDPKVYLSLCSRVTHVIHNAWSMDFRQHIGSYQPQFRTMKNIISFASQSSTWSGHIRRTKLLFVSSIAVVGQYPKVYGQSLIPEQPVVDEKCTNMMGYAEAKLVCERLIENAMNGTLQDLLETAVVRVGQMAGSSRGGYWNTAEHVPAMLQLSQQAGALPDLSGTLSWTPVDRAADILCDICLFDGHISGVYHLENPVRQAWSQTLKVLSSNMGHLPLLPYDEWISLIKAIATAVNKESGTAIQLLDFFEHDFMYMADGSVCLDTARTRQVSETLRQLAVIDEDTIGQYIRYWKDVGFLKH